MAVFIGLTQQDSKRLLHLVCVNVAAIAYIRPDGSGCTVTLADKNLTTLRVEESFERVAELIGEATAD